MLINGSSLIGRQVLSLQVGGPVAEVVNEIIDPNDLRVVALEVDGPTIGGEVGYILDLSSVREFSSLGMIIDSTDELVEQKDIVRIDKIMQLHFHIVGLKVETKSGKKLGKVLDYTVTPGDFLVQQLIVKRPVMKSLMDPELVIPRSEIVALDDYKIIVRDEKELAKTTEKRRQTEEFVPDFVNPFRKSEALRIEEKE